VIKCWTRAAASSSPRSYAIVTSPVASFSRSIDMHSFHLLMCSKSSSRGKSLLSKAVIHRNATPMTRCQSWQPDWTRALALNNRGLIGHSQQRHCSLAADVPELGCADLCLDAIHHQRVHECDQPLDVSALEVRRQPQVRDYSLT